MDKASLFVVSGVANQRLKKYILVTDHQTCFFILVDFDCSINVQFATSNSDDRCSFYSTCILHFCAVLVYIKSLTFLSLS